MGHFTPNLHQQRCVSWDVFLFDFFKFCMILWHIMISTQTWNIWNFQVFLEESFTVPQISFVPKTICLSLVQIYFVSHLFILHDFKSNMTRCYNEQTKVNICPSKGTPCLGQIRNFNSILGPQLVSLSWDSLKFLFKLKLLFPKSFSSHFFQHHCTRANQIF